MTSKYDDVSENNSIINIKPYSPMKYYSLIMERIFRLTTVRLSNWLDTSIRIDITF